MRLDEMYYTEIEMEWMKEILKEKEIEIEKLRKEKKNLKDKIDRLESDLLIYKNQYWVLTD